MTDMQVDPEALILHAGHVEMSATHVDQIAGAVATLDAEAFGLMCAFLPPILNQAWPTNLQAIRATAESLRTTANQLRTAANDLAETDQVIASEASRQSAIIAAMEGGNL